MMVMLAKRVYRLSRCRSGVAAIEFAIVAPVFFLMVFGLLAYAIYFGMVHSVQQLAADAARASVAGITSDERAALARSNIANALSSYPLLDPRKLTVAAAPSGTDPNLFAVDLRYDASANTIFALEGIVPMPPRVIERQAVIRRGGY
ncbi:MAG TPA: TadE/TadG family type IV pilus assembly protein [Xanthobacteraceae bacterium]|nr:TadE/TadG family type IV pilus assembly protein [Xanthobacteraceae bacterium]